MGLSLHRGLLEGETVNPKVVAHLPHLQIKDGENQKRAGVSDAMMPGISPSKFYKI